MQPASPQQPAPLMLSVEHLAEHEAFRAKAEVRLSKRLREFKDDADVEVGLIAFIHEAFFSFAYAALDSHGALEKYLRDSGQAPQPITVVRRALEDHLSELTERVFNTKHPARHMSERNRYKGRFCTIAIDFIKTNEAWEQLQQDLSELAELQANGFIYTERAEKRFNKLVNQLVSGFADDEEGRWDELRRIESGFIYSTLGEAESYYRSNDATAFDESKLREVANKITGDTSDKRRHDLLEFLSLPTEYVDELKSIDRVAVERYFRDAGLTRDEIIGEDRTDVNLTSNESARTKRAGRPAEDGLTKLIHEVAAGFTDWRTNDDTFRSLLKALDKNGVDFKNTGDDSFARWDEFGLVEPKKCRQRLDYHLKKPVSATR